MTLTLYHYAHCPFCVRVRMALGYLNLEYRSVILSYDDEVTPVKLTGKKMLPVLAHDGGAMNESLDIIAFVDKTNALNVKGVTTASDYKAFEEVLSKLGNPVHALAMPHWVYTKEFTPEARAYFQKKKEEKRGPFKDLVKNQQRFLDELAPLLKQLEEKLQPFYESKTFSLKDILIASHIWGLYVVPEFQFSDKVHNYLQSIKKLCHFNYQADLWS